MFNQILGEQHLTRGHLSARADYFYNSQQAATYYYVNVVPMWKTINAGNWEIVERSVRNLAFNKRKTLSVWTGSGANLQLVNRNRQLVDVFLHSTHPRADRKFHVTVPRFIFKLIFEPINRQAVVIITINNPYWRFSSNDIVCPDIIHQLKWLSGLDNTNYQLGYTYACTYSSFIRLMPSLPVLPQELTLLKG